MYPPLNFSYLHPKARANYFFLGASNRANLPGSTCVVSSCYACQATNRATAYLAARAFSRRRVFFFSVVATLPTTLATLISFASRT